MKSEISEGKRELGRNSKQIEVSKLCSLLCRWLGQFYSKRFDVRRELKQSELNRDTGNTKIGILLFVVVALIFSITIVKLKQGSLMQGYDHIIRQNMLEKDDE